MSDIRVCLQDLEQLLSEKRILIGKLESECWEDRLKIAPVLEVSRAEEARPEFSVRKARLGKRLGDGRFPGPGQAVQPEHPLIPFGCQPLFDLPEDVLPRAPQATLPVPTAVPSVWGVIHPIKKGEVR